MWGALGALAGVLSSIIVGLVLMWVRRGAETRERTGELSARLTGIHVSVEHLGEDIRELKSDTRERWANVSARFDALPCKDLCAGITAIRGGKDGRGQAAP